VKAYSKCVEPLRSWRIGLFCVLATLGHGVAVHAQGAGNANERTRSTTQRSSNSSYNRLTTARQGVVSTSSGTARTSVASGRMSQGDSLHPYSDQALAQAGRANSEIPSSSTQQPRPESRPVAVRSTPHNYYPSMRTGQYPNANRAQITSGRVGARHICVPSRGQSMAGAVRGR